MTIFEQRALNENHPPGGQFDGRPSSTHTNRAMPEGPTREEVNAQLALVESRTDTKVARLEGKIDTLSATLVGRLDALSKEIAESRGEGRTTRWILFSTIIGGLFALAALLYALVTYGDATFGRGMDVQKAINETVREMKKAEPAK